MARYFDVHPHNPQARAIGQVADLVRQGGVVVIPTDLSYALACRIGDAEAVQRIRDIRQLDPRHHFTLMCRDLAQASQFVRLSNPAFRAIKAVTPGPYTFVLPATRDVPRRLQHPKKQTVGIRIPDSPVVQALLAEVGEPLVSTTLTLPGDDEPMTQGWEIADRLDHLVDAVVDAGEGSTMVTTLVDYSDGEPVVLRAGSGYASRFE